MSKIISFGGGVNSVAMTIMLYKRGEIYPLVFADTMAEHPETYCYMDYFERNFLSKYGQKIVRLNPFDNSNLYPRRAKHCSLENYCLKSHIVPFRVWRFCTQDWKVKPLLSFQDGKIALVAFAYDESRRAKDSIYPLIEEKITRQGCIEIIQNEGLSVPRKSGCFFCCFRRISQWEELYKNYPDLYMKAEALENNSKTTLRNDGISLEVLRERFESKGGELFPDYDYEELTPCMCIT